MIGLYFELAGNPSVQMLEKTICVTLILCGFLLRSTRAVCEVQFLKEPIPSISCNPYNQDSVLKLQCDIQLLPSVTNNAVNILWWLLPSGGTSNPTAISDSTFDPLLQIHQTTLTQNGIVSSTITINGSLLGSQTRAGSYYCQASLNQDIYQPSVMLMLESAINYQNRPPCRDIQVQNSTRCVNNEPSPSTSPPEMVSSSSSRTTSTTTGRLGFIVRTIEEDLHIGIYVLILLLVVILGLSTVTIMAVLARKCDKRKVNSTHMPGVSSQYQCAVTEVDIEMQNLNSPLKTKNSTIPKDELKSSYLSPQPPDDKHPIRNRSDTYTSMKPADEKSINNAQSKENIQNSVLFTSLPPKPFKNSIEDLQSANAKTGEDLYEELPEISPYPGDVLTKGKTKATDKTEINHETPSEAITDGYTSMDASITHAPARKTKPRPQLPPTPRTAGSTGSMQKKLAGSPLSPKVPTQTSEKPFLPLPPPMEDLVVYDDMKENVEKSSLENDFHTACDENSYDVIPAEACMSHNQAYGALGDENRTTMDTNRDTIYESLDQEDGLYTAMT